MKLSATPSVRPASILLRCSENICHASPENRQTPDTPQEGWMYFETQGAEINPREVPKAIGVGPSRSLARHETFCVYTLDSHDPLS